MTPPTRSTIAVGDDLTPHDEPLTVDTTSNADAVTAAETRWSADLAAFRQRAVERLATVGEAMTTPTLYARPHTPNVVSVDGDDHSERFADAVEAVNDHRRPSLFDPCTANLLATLAGGDIDHTIEYSVADGVDCGRCRPQSGSLRSRLQHPSNIGAGRSSSDPTDQVLSASEFNRLPPWQRDLIADLVGDAFADANEGEGDGSIAADDPSATAAC